MKIDKRNPVHWWYLAIFGLYTLLAMLLRPFVARPEKPLVLLYGHKLHGNLRSLHDAVKRLPDSPIEIAFLGMDPDYCKSLAGGACKVISAVSPRVILALARVNSIVSDHGLHVMSWLPARSNIKFADVWHGIPFKGWDESDFKVLHGYDELWVSSALLKSIYVQKFGFKSEQIHATGYGRTDRLVSARRAQSIDHPDSTNELRERLGVAPEQRIVLFAPTWQHGTAAHKLFPFDSSAEEFFSRMADVCRAHQSIGLFRTHLNTSPANFAKVDGIHFAPSQDFPDTEAILLLADVMVCDWSSIAFDFLVLQRPTIFLDVPHPFPKGLTLGPEYRFGEIIGSLDELSLTVSRYLAEPQSYVDGHARRAEDVEMLVYDQLADGQAAERYCERLLQLVKK